MTNHAFLYLKKKVPLTQIVKDIREIIDRRFAKLKDRLVIEIVDDDIIKKTKMIAVYFKDDDNGQIFLMWYDKKTLEIRPNKVSGNDWVGVVIKHELSHRYNALIGDSGVEEKWMGDVTKYQTFYAFKMMGQDDESKFNKHAIRYCESQVEYFKCDIFTDGMPEKLKPKQLWNAIKRKVMKI